MVTTRKEGINVWVECNIHEHKHKSLIIMLLHIKENSVYIFFTVPTYFKRLLTSLQANQVLQVSDNNNQKSRADDRRHVHN